MRGLIRFLAFLAVLTPLLAGGAAPTAGQGASPYEPPAARILSVSPDGSMVVGTPGMAPTALCTYAVPSGEEIACANLEDGAGGQERGINLEMTDISWSPDSSTIAFAENPFTRFLDGDLWIMDALTGELTNVTDDGYEGELPVFGDIDFDGPVYADVIPRWSPDSSTLAYSRTMITGSDDPTPSELWVLDLESGESRRVARVAEEGMGILYFNLAWAPDGVTVYVSHYNYQNPIDQVNGIWAFDIESGDGEQIVGITERFDGAAPAVMAASPRGDYLTIYYPRFISEFGIRESGYALFDLEAGEIVPLPVPEELESETPVLTLSPGFSPDGASVIYGVRRFQTPASTLAMIDLDSGGVEVVAEVSEEIVPFVVAMQDGIRINLDGVAFVQTSLNTGLLVSVPQVGLEAPPIVETPPVTSDQSTPEATGDDIPTGVATIGDEGTEIYAAPSFDGPVVLTLDAGAEIEIIGEPVTNDEGTWIPVRDPDTRTIGYIPRDALSE